MAKRRAPEIIPDRGLATVVRAFLRAQRDAVLHTILVRDSTLVDLTGWNQGVMDAVAPHYSRITGTEFRSFLARYLRGGPERRHPISRYPFSIEVPEVREFIRQQSYAFASTVNQTSQQHARAAARQFRDALSTWLDRGESQRQLTRRIDRIFRNPERSSMIAVTETSRSLHGGQYLAAKRFVEPTTKEWIASEDACDVCKAMAALGPIPLDQPFHVDGKGGPYAVTMFPPGHPNCVLPDTPVVLPGLQAALTARYSGPIIQIVMASGDTFAVTPNHMLLTPTGFAAAKLLVEGTDVICCRLAKPSLATVPNNNGEPAVAQQIIAAFAEAGGMPAGTMPHGIDLHGDARFVQGQINVVNANGFLWNRIQSQLVKPISDLSFFWRRLANSLNTDRSIDLFLDGCFRATAGLVGLERDRAANLWRPISSGDGNGGGIATRFNSATQEQATYHRPRDTARPSNTLLSFPGGVTTDRIISIKSASYSGHVFDFQTRSTMYLIGNGIVSSNCMCSYILAVV